MLGTLLQPEIKELIEKKQFSLLKELFGEWSAADLADLLADIPVEQQAILFRILPRSVSADIFEYLDLDNQKSILTALGQKDTADILNEMSPDDRTALLEELPPAAVRQILTLLSREEGLVARALLGYPEDSVGRIMTPDFIAVRENMTVHGVLDHIRKNGKDSETMDMIYVVDKQGVLLDELPIRKILLSTPKTRISSIMDRKFVSLRVDDNQETAVAAFRKYDLYAIPVLDTKGCLVGIVTLDDVLDVAEEEATEDMQKVGGMEALDEPYLAAPLARIVRKRASWLVVLFLSEMLTASAMAFFEQEIARAVVLALFVPLIISSGGNSGSQATTLIIRGLAVGEFGLRDWWKVMYREIASGAMLGLILGTIGFCRISLWQALFGIYGQYWLFVAATVALSLVGVVMWGTIAGSMLPFILKRLRIDPATSSAPFVATLVDVSGLVIYFNVAYWVLRGRLL